MNRIASLATRTATIVSLSVACALPAFAQSTGTSGGGTTGPSVETRRATDSDRDYGWLGLLGLAGLLGLRRKHDHHVDTTTDTRRTTPSR